MIYTGFRSVQHDEETSEYSIVGSGLSPINQGSDDGECGCIAGAMLAQLAACEQSGYFEGEFTDE